MSVRMTTSTHTPTDECPVENYSQNTRKGWMAQAEEKKALEFTLPGLR